MLVEMHKAVRNYARQYAHVRSMLRKLRGQSPAIDRANAWFTWAEFRWAASVRFSVICFVGLLRYCGRTMC